MMNEHSRAPSIDIKILVADDHSMIRSMVSSILGSAGFHNIFEAETGLDAVHLVITEDIDLVICDWNMPKGTGIEVLKKLRADARFKDLPFLMLTAEGYRESVLEASRAGVTEFVVKPFTADVLLSKIDQIVRRTRRSASKGKSQSS